MNAAKDSKESAAGAAATTGSRILSRLKQAEYPNANLREGTLKASARKLKLSGLKENAGANAAVRLNINPAVFTAGSLVF